MAKYNLKDSIITETAREKGYRVEITIDRGELMAMLFKAAKSRGKRSVAGPVALKLTRIID